MKKTPWTIACLLFAAMPFVGLRAQNDPIVMEVAGQQIRRSEFMQDFWHSVGENLAAKPNVTPDEKRKALNEYADLYANFRAKIVDARSMGMDTAANLRAELQKYRAELAAPYLIDSNTLSRILHEAYERNRYGLHVAQVLVRLDPDAPPADTLEAYQHALELRNRLLNGESFVDVATSEILRHDPKARVRPNEGEISYFTVFDMVYPFESAAYSMKPGELSMPVRSPYGYHIIRLIDKVEFYGQVTLQHMWLRDANNKAAIADAYDRLLQGTPFEIIVRQSDDYSSSNTGGYISNATMGQLPHEYVKVISGLKEGEFSKPFLTRYGWHIVKLVKRETMPDFKTKEPVYKQIMARDPLRGYASRKSFAETAIKKYGIVDLTKTPVKNTATKGKKGKKNKQPEEMMASLDQMESLLNDSVFSAIWRFKESDIKDLRPLVRTPSRDYNTVDLAWFIRNNQKPHRIVEKSLYLHQQYPKFVDSVAIAYADSQLEKENPEFAATVEEYQRGLMIFNYNDKMIWTKAILDSAGFADFYARESKTKRIDNPDDSLFFWRTRARVVVCNISDSLCLAPSKAERLLRKALKKSSSMYEIQEMLTDKVNTKKCTETEPVTVVTDMVEMKRQKLLSDSQWKPGVYLTPAAKGYQAVMVQDILEPSLKEQSDARGYYLSAWQNEVEQKLISDLRSKYNVKINWDAIGQISY